jgi:hypothetical protein
MPLEAYVRKRFSPKVRRLIDQANEIIEEYAAAGYDLTLRQLYYQMVARDILPNLVRSYKNLGNAINDARLAGLIDWERIEDRTRGLESLAHWDSPQQIVSSCARQFRVDVWANQPYRVEVWIEKEALAGVFSRICNELRVPYLSCRGFTSQSEMWRAAKRLRKYNEEDGQCVKILHFGDHDPSGIDMSRDIRERMAVFGVDLEFSRLALNKVQVDEYKPPPNPAKATDSRFAEYQLAYGDESWELDALPPDVLADLVRNAVDDLINHDRWKETIAIENEHRRKLGVVAEQWETLTKKL